MHFYHPPTKTVGEDKKMRKISQNTEMTLVTLTLTLGPQGHWGMLTLSKPTYHVNMVIIRAH